MIQRIKKEVVQEAWKKLSKYNYPMPIIEGYLLDDKEYLELRERLRKEGFQEDTREYNRVVDIANTYGVAVMNIQRGINFHIYIRNSSQVSFDVVLEHELKHVFSSRFE